MFLPCGAILAHSLSAHLVDALEDLELPVDGLQSGFASALSRATLRPASGRPPSSRSRLVQVRFNPRQTNAPLQHAIHAFADGCTAFQIGGRHLECQRLVLLQFFPCVRDLLFDPPQFALIMSEFDDGESSDSACSESHCSRMRPGRHISSTPRNLMKTGGGASGPSPFSIQSAKPWFVARQRPLRLRGPWQKDNIQNVVARLGCNFARCRRRGLAQHGITRCRILESHQHSIVAGDMFDKSDAASTAPSRAWTVSLILWTASTHKAAVTMVSGVRRTGCAPRSLRSDTPPRNRQNQAHR